jgi:4-amino-4-deoxy-L-arabinose transferase-like glycosyltransferase
LNPEAFSHAAQISGPRVPVKSDTKFLKSVLLVLLLAIALRLVWGTLIPVVPVSDGDAYDIAARMLAEHGVYGWAPDRPSAYWPVGTSAIYAALYFVFGHSFTSIVVLNIALSSAIVGLTIWLGRIFFNDTIGLIAGGLMAIWPTEVAFVTILSSELPFTLLFLLGFVAWFSIRITNWFVRAVASGLAFGAATYVRPAAILLPIVLWLSALPNWRKLRERLPVLLLAIIVIGVTIAPWSIRNTKLFGHFVMLSTNGGVTLWIGNNPNSTGYYMDPYADPPASTKGLNEYEQDKAFEQEALRYIFERPASFVARSMKKAVLIYIGETTAIHWNVEGLKQRFGESVLFPLKLLTQSFWTVVLLLALAGLIIMLKEFGPVPTLTNPVVLTLAYFTAFYALFQAADRYHFPSHPFVALLAANAILFIAKRRKNT